MPVSGQDARPTQQSSSTLLGGLLKSTFSVPPLPPAHVARHRLVETLNKGLERGCKLTLICAPAGYGKTTLAIEWMVSTNRRVAWVTLDEDDCSPQSFWRSLMAALHATEESIGGFLLGAVQSDSAASLNRVIAVLLNVLSGLDEPLFLVLDDYPTDSHGALNETMRRFVDHLPSQVHVVITTRVEPALSLPRRRARMEITEIGAAELAFTVPEAGTLVRAVGLQLSQDQTRALHSHCEGWVTALVLAIASLERHPGSAGLLPAGIGTERYVAEYLREEGLSRLSAEARSFLQRTSILRRMTAPLCDAVTDRADSRQMLESLARMNLFVQPLDEGGGWYRYHQLVADALRSDFEQSDPYEYGECQLRASVWFDDHGFYAEGFRHALTAGDTQRCADIVERRYWEILHGGDEALLSSWLAQIPESLFERRPWLGIVSVRLHMAKMEQDRAALRLRQVERTLEDYGVAESPERTALSHELVLWRAVLRVAVDDYSGSLEELGWLLSNVEDDFWALSIAGIIAASAYRGLGQTESALGSYARALSFALQRQGWYDAFAIYDSWADLLILEGRLLEAEAVCQEALELARRAPRPGRFLWKIEANLARIRYEWGQLQIAGRHARVDTRDAVFLNTDAVTLAHLQLVRLQLGIAGVDVVDLWEADARRLTAQSMSAVHACQIRSWMAQGKTERADRLVRRLGLDQAAPTPSNALLLLAYGRWLIARRHPDRAMRLLHDMAADLHAEDHEGLLIQIRILQAMAFVALGDTRHALVPLQQALALAEPEGYVRSFVDAGRPFKRLLHRALETDISSHYVAKLLSAFPASGEGRDSGYAGAKPEDYVEPLSARELDTLRLLAEGYSYEEIARCLGITLNTVRSHTQSLYRKLRVNSSARAVAKSTRLGLLRAP